MEFVSMFSKTDWRARRFVGSQHEAGREQSDFAGCLGRCASEGAQEPSLDLISKTINSACIRVQALGQASNHIIRLAEIGAWTEAAFALIAGELPLWTVRRLIYDMASGCVRYHGSRICQ
jgi:hypothetical protein